MRRPLKKCSDPWCAHQVVRGACPQHAVRDNVTIRRLYKTPRWRALRVVVLRDQAYACAQCGQVQVRLDIDHRRPHRNDPARFWDRANLQALCPSCHSEKTAHGD